MDFSSLEIANLPMSRERVLLEPLALLSAGVAEAVYAVGPDGRILFWNHGCEVLTGRSADEVLGDSCSEGEGQDDAAKPVLHGLASPPEVDRGQIRSMMVELPGADGGLIQRPVLFFPCHDEQKELLYILALVGAEGSAPGLSATPGPNLQVELRQLRHRLAKRFDFEKIVFRCPAMQRAMEQAKTAAACDVPLLIRGGRGTGKELVARAIHYASERREAPFLPIDCAALGPEMLERTWTWLDRSYDGLSAAYAIPAAGQPGTVYLEEILALPRDFQARILPFVSRDAPHEGSDGEPRKAPRLIVSTTIDLREALQNGSLREDLYYAVTAIRIDLPPLRERRDDVALLSQHFLESQNDGATRRVGSFSDEALDVLAHYHWPGNVRELIETVQRAHSRATSSQVQLEDLPLRLRSAYDAVSISPAADELPMKLDELLVRVETKLIRLALQRSRGNKSQAADLLGISRPRLYRRMDVLGIDEDGAAE